MPFPGPPFAGAESIAVVIPDPQAGQDAEEQQRLHNIPAIFRESLAGLERELGAPLRLVTADPGRGPRWLIGPARCNPALAGRRPVPPTDPELVLDREANLLISDAATAAGVWDTFSLLRSLARLPGGTLRVADCPDVPAAIERIVDEVGDSYPSFALRGLDWAAICALHQDRVAAAADPIPAMQEWLAELHDPHTWVRPAGPVGVLPYQVWATPEAAVLVSVPCDSAGWAAGARPGYRLLDVDPAGGWRRSSAAPHARPLTVGRRLLQAPVGTVRALVAESPGGARVRWSEEVRAFPWPAPVTWEVLPSGTGYLKIRTLVSGQGVEAALDAAFADLRGRDRLIVDLRANSGGSLALAVAFRNRFLREAGVMGSIRYSTGPGGLAPSEPIRGEPAPEADRWSGAVRFLTDPLTFSAAEDALLGLQGLPHVQIVGESSGGGSGRMRLLRLLPGWMLAVSTAITYDRQGRPVEGAGIVVDRPVRPDRFAPAAPDLVLQEADRRW